jgi:hypothetical protein
MADLSELIARVEGATGPDRELDTLIEVAARWIEAGRVGLAPEHRAKWRGSRSGYVSDGFSTYAAERYTSSLDAALALCERVLPGWTARLWISERRSACVLTDDLGSDGETYAAPTAPLAVILAVLRALHHKEQER